MAHIESISAAPLAKQALAVYTGPMPAVSNPKLDFIESVHLAIQNYRQEKQIGL